ncbi:elongation factor 1-gamma-like [Symphalangus syndactylus]|uniref:elongation factor 1-gamma-like n=1 Tax=Symphalangus syndactylus TaxID=9590 RepID=UPI002442A6AC|nr:elongation factor 1-gamma-like [Symphalangus syndactylus]
MTTGTLYTYPENWRAFKALIAAQYSGAQVHVLSAPPHFHFGQTNRMPEFLCKFPAGKFPAFEGDGGFCVFESNAITYYVNNEELRGSTPEAAALVAQWVSFADSGRVPPASAWVFPIMGITHHNKQAAQNAKEEVRRILGLLDAHLKTRIPPLTCPRVPLCWVTARTPTRTHCLWHCHISGSTLMRMASPCDTQSIVSLKSSLGSS